MKLGHFLVRKLRFPTRRLYLWQTNHNEAYTYSAGCFNSNAGGEIESFNDPIWILYRYD